MTPRTVVTLLGAMLVVASARCTSSDERPRGTPEADATATDAAPDGTRDDASTPDASDAAAEAPMPWARCERTARGARRGSPIALSDDEDLLVAVNRDYDSTLSVFDIGVTSGVPSPPVRRGAPLEGLGREAMQVALDACGDTAWIALRHGGVVKEIRGLRTTPRVTRQVEVGSEPTAIAASPNHRRVYVANWIQGTVDVIDTATLTVSFTYDLNRTLAATTLLGPTVNDRTYRPGLAHPRALAITNDGDDDDDDETVLVTEYFSQRAEPHTPTGDNADTSRVGLLYALAPGRMEAVAIRLPALQDTGFPDSRGQTTGCFPNGVASITVQDGFAYVLSTCASPEGPTGRAPKNRCVGDAACAAVAPGSRCQAATGSCSKTCNAGGVADDALCGTGAHAGACRVDLDGACEPIATDVKATVHPVLHVVDIAKAMAPGDGGAASDAIVSITNLNAEFLARYERTSTPDDAARRMPLMAGDLAFDGAGTTALFTAHGADAVFGLRRAADTGEFLEVTPDHLPAYVDLGLSEYPDGSNLEAHGPVGIAVSRMSPTAYVLSEFSRNVSVVDTMTMSARTFSAGVPVVVSSAPLPQTDEGRAILHGRLAFSTGLGRWSFRGQAWMACQSCHFEGLTDGVTWYLARGPRQSPSLETMFSKSAPGEQRIFNWTAVFDETSDFETIARSLHGAVGALVKEDNHPASFADRLPLDPAKNGGLSGSSAAPVLVGDAGVVTAVTDWADIESWIRTLRPVRPPRGLSEARQRAGAVRFVDAGCAGCHSGPFWTVSRRSYTPSWEASQALLSTPWGDDAVAAGFPEALLPATTGNRRVRAPFPVNVDEDHIQCVLRNVGTFGTSPADVGVAEVRGNMKTVAQGANGYNVPSLIGLGAGAPFYHAGNARTLEELLSDTFATHRDALAQKADALSSPEAIAELVEFLLAIPELPGGLPRWPAVPEAGAAGGDLCTTLRPSDAGTD